MKTIITAIAAATMLATAPASAQTYVLVIGDFPSTEQDTIEITPNLEQRIEIAIDKVCQQPFIRNLRGWELYTACREEVRSEIDAQLAENSGQAVTLAMR